AASIAGLLIAPMIFRNPPTPSKPPPSTPNTEVVQNPSPSTSQPMVHFVQNRTWDDGAAIVDKDRTGPAPARRIVREQVDRIRYYDQDQHAWIEILVPHRQEELLEVDPY